MAGFRTIELSDPGISAEGLRFVTVKSAALGARADLCIWVAPGAEPGSAAPLIVLMHGVYGSHWAWALKGGAHLCAARLVAEGALPPVVLAMPSDGLWGDGSGYVPHQDRDFERWIIDEVPLAAAEATHVCDPRSPLLLAGLSMGGFAALRLAGKYPGRITAAAAHSAVTRAAALDPLIAESREHWSMRPEDVSVEVALTAAPKPLPPLRFDCGRDDPFLPDNRALHLALDHAGIPHRYREAEGGHDWTYWSREIERTLRFFGRVLADTTEGKQGEDR
ncbi:alpha/beta fold hydrolase [Sphingomonas gilva]|uniref:Alpha/beta fold hydrolase n=1 Tax=Sphingomonas gilva TaxID=2305907 RepID=A0A396RRM7_9SPHN|nr:alpha/beta hydrolase-fold protein [Sphingomonas gilva]RHW19294.1 alpha/beta fold hydrolase [Sphingomonas gilva]